MINFLHIGQELKIGSKKKIVFQLFITFMLYGKSKKNKMVGLGSKLDLIPSHMKLIKKIVKRNPLMSLYW